MKNYKITVQYDGTKYNGWQKQGNTRNTIQERFENVLSKMCGKETEIYSLYPCNQTNMLKTLLLSAVLLLKDKGGYR